MEPEFNFTNGVCQNGYLRVLIIDFERRKGEVEWRIIM